MGKWLAVQADTVREDGTPRHYYVPSPGTANAELTALQAARVEATLLGCSSYSFPGDGWPTYEVVVDVAWSDVPKASAMGFYEIKRDDYVKDTVVVDGKTSTDQTLADVTAQFSLPRVFPCSAKDL